MRSKSLFPRKQSRERWNWLRVGIVGALLLFPVFAFAANERVKDYFVHIELAKDGSALIQEELLYDFDTLERHGIFRKIPQVMKRADGSEFFIEITDVSVVDGHGKDLLATLEQGNVVTMRIGDPELLVTGTQVYVIRYRVAPVINTATELDEFYWNITGNDWLVPIDRVAAEVVLPEEEARGDVQWICFKGTYGTTKECLSDVFPPDSTSTISMVRFLAEGFGPHQGMTVSVGIPKGTFDPSLFIVPSRPAGSTGDDIQINRTVAVTLPVLTLVAMFLIWWTHGRDPKGRGAIVVEYTPPDDLPPLEARALLLGHVGQRGISAQIIDLARRGFFDIEEVEKKGIFFDSKDYQLTRHRDAKGELSAYDSMLIAELFSNAGRDLSYLRLSQLKEWKKDLAPTIGKIEKSVLQTLVENGYYVENPSTVRGAYLGAAFGLLVIGFFSGGFAVGICASAVIIGIFAFIMPKTTPKGAIMRERILGFKEYLSVAEAERIAFANAPERKPEEFEKLLPYAMAFEVEDAWAEQFKRIYDAYGKSPSWYHGNPGTAFSAAAFTQSMSSFSSHTSNAMTSASTSSHGGGGFSGGGMGGGGGGSW